MSRLNNVLRSPVVLALCALLCVPGLRAKADVHVVFIGNSITYGATLANPSTEAPPVIVGQLLRKRVEPSVLVRNCAISGYTTFNFLPGQAQYTAVVNAGRDMSKTYGPLYFSIMLGTNDSAEQGPLGSPVSTDTYKANMKKIIDALHARFPRAKFLVNYPIWYSPNTHNGAVYLQAGLDRLKSYFPIIDAIVSEYAASNEGMVYAGTKDAFSFFEGNTDYLTAEAGNSGTFYLHPNAAGARKLAEFWTESIIKMLADDGIQDKGSGDISDTGWVRGEDLLTSASQIVANSTESDQFTTDNLLRPETDGYGTNEFIWHNSWTDPLPADSDTYLQFHLNKAVGDIFFSMTSSEWDGTYDTPKDIDIYATNTPDDESSWKKVAELRDLVTEVTHPVIYDSPHVGLGGDSYTDLRFVVKGTNNNRHTTTGSLLVNLGRFQMAEAEKAEDAQAKLQALLDDLSALNLAYEGGTEPGYYSAEAVAAYTDAFEAANYTLAQSSATDDDFAKAEQNLRSAYNAVEASLVPIADGYYYVKSAYPNFAESQGVAKAMYAGTDGSLAWGTLSRKDPKYLFKITNNDDGSYAIQSVYSGKYIGTTNGTGTVVRFADTAATPQTIKQIGTTPQFNIANPTDAIAYNAEGNNGGTGTSGRVILYGGKSNTASAWQLETQADAQLIDSLAKAGEKDRLADQINSAITAADKIRDLAFEYTPLLTDGSQIVANSTESSQFVTANLLRPESDGYGTGQYIWHNSWTSPLPASEDTYLQFRLSAPAGEILFSMISSEWDGTYDTPKDIDIYGTDTPDDESSWEKAAELRDVVTQVVHPVRYTSPRISLGKSYGSLRFVVRGTNHDRHNANGSLLVNLGRIQVYSTEPMEHSEYFTVDGMKAACDNYAQVVSDVRARLAAGTASAGDISAVNAAAEAIRALYINRDSVFEAYTSLLAQAQQAYDNAVPTLQAVITSGSQITANSVQSDQFTPANLIRPESDGYGTNQYIFHSSWSNPLPAGEYPYLQVSLSSPLSAFVFSMISSEWDGTYDTPRDIDIYATNTPDDESSWQEVSELRDIVTAVAHPVRYTSPMIDLGAEYSNVRFVVKSTVNMRGPEGGMFYLSLGRFQMYTGIDPEIVQYNYNPDVKAAADALKALIDAGAGKTVYTVQTKDITELQAALSSLLSAFADTTGLVRLYNQMLTKAGNMTVGEEIGTVDDEGSIDDFVAALGEARSLVSARQPMRAQITAATEGINKAYADFLTHVRQIEAGKWYYIRANADVAYCAGKAMYLDSPDSGAEIRFGQYDGEDADTQPYTENPFAMWRFVPVEGTEYFSIQNLATSHSIAPTSGRGNENRCHVQTGYAPFMVDYVGKGRLQFVSIGADGTAQPYQIHAQEDGSVIVPWATDVDGASSWSVEPVEDDTYIEFPVETGSTAIMTLPFDIAAGSNSLMTMNPNVKTYEIRSAATDASTGQTTLGLAITDEVKAGVPFILVEDGSNADAAAGGKVGVYATLPATVDTLARESNGLVGTLAGATLSQGSLGYFSGGSLELTGGAAVHVSGMSGWIDFSKITSQAGEADITINVNGIVNSVGKVVAGAGNADAAVSVYTIDGKLVRRNVRAAAATDGLAKGVYIVGKKKVLVR